MVGGDLNVDLRKEVHSNKKFVLAMMEEYDLHTPPGMISERCSFYINETAPVSLLDYFLVGRESMHLIQECSIPDRSALNKSDHEPVFLKIATAANLAQKRRDRTKIDWGKARKQRKIEEYQSRIRECMSDLNVDLRKEVHSNKKFVLAMMEEYDLHTPPGMISERCSFYINETAPVSLLDYFLVGRESMHLIQECSIPDRSALNKSDHEPVFLKIATAANLAQKRRDRTKIDWGKARKQRKIEEYQSRIRECMSDGIPQLLTTLQGRSFNQQRYFQLPRKGKLNRASRWWTSGLTELRRACLTAREAWKVAVLLS